MQTQSSISELISQLQAEKAAAAEQLAQLAAESERQAERGAGTVGRLTALLRPGERDAMATRMAELKERIDAIDRGVAFAQDDLRREREREAGERLLAARPKLNTARRETLEALDAFLAALEREDAVVNQARSDGAPVTACSLGVVDLSARAVRERLSVLRYELRRSEDSLLPEFGGKKRIRLLSDALIDGEQFGPGDVADASGRRAHELITNHRAEMVDAKTPLGRRKAA